MTAPAPAGGPVSAAAGPAARAVLSLEAKIGLLTGASLFTGAPDPTGGRSDGRRSAGRAGGRGRRCPGRRAAALLPNATGLAAGWDEDNAREAGDIGIVRIPVAHTELETRPLFSDRLVAAAPQAVPYKTSEGLASLRDRPFICLPRSVSETFADHVLSLCRRAGFTPHVVQEASEIFTTLNLVRAGLGVSLVPSTAVRMHVPGVRFHNVHMPEAEWHIGVAWHKSAEKAALIARFVSTIRTVVGK